MSPIRTAARTAHNWRFWATIVVLFPLIVLACSDGGPADVEEIISGIGLSQNTVTLFVGDSKTVEAIVKDQTGAQIDLTKANKTITWSSSNPSVAVVSQQGVIIALNAGSTDISATVENRTATALVMVKSVPTQIVSLIPANTRGRVGQPFPGGVSIRLADAAGAGVSSVPVEFTVLTGGGSVTPAQTTTDGQGQATASWTLGNAAGEQRIRVRARLSTAFGAPAAGPQAAPPADLVQEIAVIADANTATSITLAPASQQIAAGAQGSVTPTVRDNLQNVVTGLTVNYTSSDRTIVDPDAQGRFVGRRVGTATITGSVAGAASVQSTATVTVVTGPPAIAIKVSGDGTVSPLAQQTLTVEIRDAGDNIVPGATVAWQLVGGTGSLNAATSTTGANGRASTTLTLGADQGTRQVQATAGGGASATFTIETPGVVISTPSPLPSGIAGTAYSTTFTVAGGKTPITFSVSAGTLPTGLTLNPTTGALTGTPSAAGTFNFTIQAATSDPLTITKSFTLQIFAAPAITTTTLPSGTVGVAYNQTVAMTGGNGTNVWSISVGTLPAGLSINSSTGAITGTPTAAGTSNFTVQVVSNGQTATQAFAVTIAAGPVTISTPSPLPGGTVGTAYSQTLAAAGGDGTSYAWSLSSGTLPTGVTLSTAGVLSGTPTVANTFNFTVQASSGGQNVTKAFAVTIAAGPVTISTPSSLPGGTVGTAYSQTLAATGGNGTSYTWSLSSGTLPTGVTLSTAGVLSGTPTVANTFNFTVQASSGGQNATKAFAVTIAAGPVTISTPSSLPGGTVGTAYSQTLAAAGGDEVSYTWSLSSGTLPTGVTLSTAGVLSGTPTVANTFNFTVQASSGGQNATKAFAVTIAAGPVTISTPSPLPGGTVGTAYSQTLAAAGGDGTSYAWSLSSGTLPTGVTLSTAGVLSGTPTVANTFNFTVQASSGGQNVTKAFAVTIAAGPVTISTPSPLPGGTVGTAYSQTLAAVGGDGTSYAWSLSSGTLPTGVTLSTAGVLSGTPTVANTFNFTVQASSGGQNVTKAFAVTIAAGPVTISTPSPLAPGTVGTAYSQTLAATGGNGTSYTWSLSSGTLPTSVTLSTAGVLSGTPTVANTFNFTVQASSGGQNVTKAFAVTIAAGPVTISTPSSLPGGTVGTAYSQTLAATGGNGTSYTWSLSSGTLPTSVTLSTAGVLSGTPTVANTFNFTVQASSGGQNVTKAFAVTINPSGGPTPLLLEDFSTYTSTTNLLADPRNIWDNVERANTGAPGDPSNTDGGAVVLDTSVGYGSSTKSMRYDFPNLGSLCKDYRIRPGYLQIPGNQTHVWVEYVVTFGTTGIPFKVDHGTTSCAKEYKLAAMGDSDGQAVGRWNVPEMQATDWVLGYPNAVFALNVPSNREPQDIWDGQPHVFRVEAQLGPSGLVRFWVDGVLTGQMTNLNTVASHHVIDYFAPGLNLNQGPNISGMQMWWHKIAVYNTNPGW